MSTKEIVLFISSCHHLGRNAFQDVAFDHFITMCSCIWNHMYNGNPESKFIECCCNEQWDRAYKMADSHNRQAMDVINLYKLFVAHVKENPDYIKKIRDEKINSIIDV